MNEFHPEGKFMTIRRCLLLCLLAVCVFEIVAMAAGEASEGSTFALKDGWSIQSSAKVEATGERLSTPQFIPKNWYRASVPTTVLNALIEDKVYPDPYYGM